MCAVSEMCKKLIFFCDNKSVRKKQIRLRWRLWWSLAEFSFGGNRSLESDGLFCVGAFGGCLASVSVKMFFTFHLLATKIFYKFVLSMLFVKIMFIPVNFNGSHYTNSRDISERLM